MKITILYTSEWLPECLHLADLLYATKQRFSMILLVFVGKTTMLVTIVEIKKPAFVVF